MTTLQVSTLGSLTIRLNGERFALPLPLKAQAMLVYLICHPGDLFSRAHLQTLLWSDTPAQKARASLRQVLRKLLAALPKEVIVQEDLAVGLNAACDYWLDLDHAATDETLYRGEFLLGFSLRGAAAWDEWLYARREAVTAQLIAQWSLSAETHATDGDYPRAIRYYHRIIELNPWQEQPHRQLMELHLRQHDAAAALAQYDKLAQLLADELGVEPAAQTVALYERILRSEGQTRASNLPPVETLTEFFGRNSDLDTLTRLLQQPKNRLLTLTGLGGIGKTRLALATAQALQSHFADGIFLVDLTSATPKTLLTTVAEALNVQLKPDGSPLSQLVAALRARQLLLLFDNVETLLPSEQIYALLKRLLTQAPEVTLLLTSRQPVQLQLEQIYQVAGLPTDAGFALFCERAQRIAPNFVAANVDAIHTICQLVDGLPLGIELAASLVRLLSVEEISAELSHNLSLLQSSFHDAPSHQRSMQGVFQASWQRLSAEQQQALARLSVFRSSFTRLAAQTVGQTTLSTLTTLTTVSLLQTAADRRMRLHPLLRQFAAAQLHEVDATRDAHAAWFVEQLHSHIRKERQNDFLLTDGENMYQAWRWLTAQRATDVLEGLTDSLHHGLMQLNRYHDAEALYGSLIERLEQEPARTPLEDSLLANLYSRFTSVKNRLGFSAEALNSAERAVALADRIEDPLQIALAYSTLGDLERRAGKFSMAFDHLQLALTLYEHARSWRQCARVLNDIGLVEGDRGNRSAAIDAFERSLAHSRRQRDENGEAYGLHNWALINQQQGAFMAAEQRLQQSLALFEGRHNQIMQASCLGNLAMGKLAFGETEAAAEILNSAETLLKQHPARPDHQTLLLRRQGRLALVQNDPTQAKALFTEAFRVASLRDYHVLAFHAYADLVEAAIAADDPSSHSLQQRLEQLATRFTLTHYHLPVQLNQAHLALANGHSQQAQTQLQALTAQAPQLNWWQQQRLHALKQP